MIVVVGLDLSLTSTGAARITPDGVTVCRIESKTRARRKTDPQPTLADRGMRLRRHATNVLSLCSGARMVCVEGPSFASSGAGTWDRAGFWWMIVNSLLASGIPVVEIPPSNLKTYALGKGNGAGTDKDQVLAAVVRRYPDVDVTGNDVADALVLAAMGARFAGFPIDDLPQTHLRGMTKVRWAV